MIGLIQRNLTSTHAEAFNATNTTCLPTEMHHCSFSASQTIFTLQIVCGKIHFPQENSCSDLRIPSTEYLGIHMCRVQPSLLLAVDPAVILLLLYSLLEQFQYAVAAY